MDRSLAVAIAAHTVRAAFDKVGMLIALGMVFGLACWALWNATPLGAYIAAGFAGFAFLWCSLFRGDRNAKDGRQGELRPERVDDVPTA